MLKNTDNISEDVLDNDFISIFKFIFYFLSLFGMHGVTIKHKFVTPATIFYKTYSCIIWVFNYVCVIYCVVRCNTRFDAKSTDIPLKVGISINCCINAFLAWKNVFLNGHTNSLLYVKLQKIERVLKMKDSRKLNKKLSKFLAILVLIALIAYLASFLLFNVYFVEGFCPSVTVAIAVNTMSCFEIFLIIVILYFLVVRARYVNEMLSQKRDCFQKIYFNRNPVLAPKEIVPDELLRGMCCILDCLADVMDEFQHAILLFIFQMLVWQLISIQNLVTSIKMQMSINILSFLCTMPSSATYMTLMLMMCHVSQWLTTTLEETKQMCTKLTLSCEGKSKENAKRMTMLFDGKREATVYDIFTLNTQLPLHLLAITASYTIVLLQIAVL